MGETLVLKRFDLYPPISLDSESVYTTHFKEIWDKDPILSLSFPAVHIAFIRTHYTIIPNRLFQETNKASFLAPLKSAATIPELYQVNDLKTLEAKLIFNLPQAAIEFFESKYNSANVFYYNSLTAIINGIAKEMIFLEGKHVWINVHPNILQIVLFDGQDLIFSNQFHFQTEKDFIYYVLLIFNQFKLNPEVTPLHISGQLVKESAIYKKLYHYIRYISFLKISKTHLLNNYLVEYPEYFFFDLLSIAVDN